MRSILYFAYGSNMLTERLQRRCPTARVHSTAVAEGYGLAFSKKGQDGSGKATLIAATSLRTYGVVFHISTNDLRQLDQIEGRGRGRGYERLTEFPVHSGIDRGTLLTATTYISGAPHIDDNLRPFDWYLDLVVHGARQNGLPSSHVEAIVDTEHAVDPAPERRERLEALQVLELAKRKG